MLRTGLSFAAETVVGESNTAAAMGSGDMDVLATPAMVALMENAAMNAVAGELPEGSATVGTAVNVSHIKASPVGTVIKASAELAVIEGRKLTFRVTAADGSGTIGEGTHIRYVVDREKFISKL